MQLDVQLIYYILAAVGLAFGAGWAGFTHVTSILKEQNRKQDAHEKKMLDLLQLDRSRYDTKFENSARRTAEISERIATLRLETYQKLGEYVTRTELDKRLEKMENMALLQSTKLDTVIERLVYRGNHDQNSR